MMGSQPGLLHLAKTEKAMKRVTIKHCLVNEIWEEVQNLCRETSALWMKKIGNSFFVMHEAAKIKIR